MSVWLAAALLAIGYILRMAHERPRRFADVDELVNQQRDRIRVGVRDV
jgi:hypothetical protein